MQATIRLRADQLAKIRKWTGLKTNAQLAEAIGTDAGNLSRILNGTQTPGAKFIGSLCMSLEASFEDIFEIVPVDEVAA